MHHPETCELRSLEAWNQPEHARLLGPLQLSLESDEAVMIAGQIVLAKLHDRRGHTARSWIRQPDRLHGPEPERVLAAVRHDFDRKTALEELRRVKVMDRRPFGMCECLIEALVLVARH